jgi:uncharacterized protein
LRPLVDGILFARSNVGHRGEQHTGRTSRQPQSKGGDSLDDLDGSVPVRPWHEMRRAGLFFVLAALATGCATSSVPEPLGPIAQPELTIGDAILHVEVASTPDARARGLMGRTELPSDLGMAFVFEGPTTGRFWMKDTLIPLSIAFWGARNRVVAILNMPPCRADPCPTYGPQRPYVGAVEADLGYFEDHGVEVGDRVQLTQPNTTQ